MFEMFVVLVKWQSEYPSNITVILQIIYLHCPGQSIRDITQNNLNIQSQPISQINIHK